jgi:hypothetical protein
MQTPAFAASPNTMSTTDLLLALKRIVENGGLRNVTLAE